MAAKDPYEEAFTIFIDLDDFLVTQVGNHEFLHPDTIHEHNNVVLHLTEEEMRHHMVQHDTHECEHPAEVHEVVSFIQEKMYEAPAAPSFIDDMIQSNYVQNNAWDNLKGPYGAPQMMSPMTQFPFNNQVWAPKAQAPVVPQTYAEAPRSQPVSAPVSAPVSVSVPKQEIAAPAAATASDPAKEEEEAVKRFRDAYQAFKYLNRAVGGLADNIPSSNTPSTEGNTDSSASHGSWWGSLFDDNDKHLLEMFTQHATNNAHPIIPPQTPARSLFGGDYDKTLSSIVDEALKNAMNPDSYAPSTQEPAHHHHHHHHHHHEEERALQPQQVAPAQPVQVAPTIEALDPHPSLTEADKKSLQDLVTVLSSKQNDVKQVLQETFRARGLTEDQATQTTETIVQAMKDQQQKSAISEPAKVPAVVQVGNTRPAAPAMISHIGQAPSPSDIIPDNVYVQQSVPFVEKLQPMKHVPKRILIPRLEEPGPVIGGGSHPMHIKLDNDGLISSTRPSAPAQLSMQMASSIATASDVASTPASNGAPVTIAVGTTNALSVGTKSMSSQQPSVKAASIASANDEALSAPEVVIF